MNVEEGDFPMKRLSAFALMLPALALISVQSVQAADSAPVAKETVVLQRVPVPGTDREMGMGIAEFPPNASKPRHKATGPEVAYVLEGEVTVQVDGQPTQVVRAGESYRMPAGVVHVTSAGPAGAKVLATWAWVPGKPFNVRVAE
jgi:quercetin dioxygenase-like cupin family protein